MRKLFVVCFGIFVAGCSVSTPTPPVALNDAYRCTIEHPGIGLAPTVYALSVYGSTAVVRMSPGTLEESYSVLRNDSDTITLAKASGHMKFPTADVMLIDKHSSTLSLKKLHHQDGFDTGATKLYPCVAL